MPMSNIVNLNIKKIFANGRLGVEGALVFIVVFCASLILFDRYVAGDLCYYRMAYQAVKGQHIFDAFITYREHIFAADVFHFIFIWVFSDIASHDVAMAFVNGCLSVAAYCFVRVNGVDERLSIALVLLNYYFWVVAIPAERLKFAILFVILFYFSRRLLPKLLFIGLGVLSHASVAVLFLPFFANAFPRSYNRASCVRGGYFLMLILIVTLVVGRDVYEKIIWISRGLEVNFLSVVPNMVLCALAIAFSQRRGVGILFVFAVISFLMWLVSSDRLNMFSLLIALGYIIESKKITQSTWLIKTAMLNFTLIAILAFLCIKTLLFFANIYSHGVGFGMVENTCP
jgi:hypothetical protein